MLIKLTQSLMKRCTASEEALAKAEREKQERQERRERSYYWRLRKKLHDAWRARDEKDEAELELELMRIGVETGGDRPKDWSLISAKGVETLRVSADHERRRSKAFTESAVRFVRSVDKAFAVFD